MMQRLINPGKRLPDKAGEPDFYEISRQYPLPQAPMSVGTPAAFTYQKPPTPNSSQAGEAKRGLLDLGGEDET